MDRRKHVILSFIGDHVISLSLNEINRKGLQVSSVLLNGSRSERRNEHAENIERESQNIPSEDRKPEPQKYESAKNYSLMS